MSHRVVRRRGRGAGGLGSPTSRCADPSLVIERCCPEHLLSPTVGATTSGLRVESQCGEHAPTGIVLRVGSPRNWYPKSGSPQRSARQDRRRPGRLSATVAGNRMRARLGRWHSSLGRTHGARRVAPRAAEVERPGVAKVEAKELVARLPRPEHRRAGLVAARHGAGCRGCVRTECQAGIPCST